MEALLGVRRFIPSHFPSLSSFLLARNLANPCLGHEPKARVVIKKVLNEMHNILNDASTLNLPNCMSMFVYLYP